MRVALFSALLLTLASGCATQSDNATGGEQAAARRAAGAGGQSATIIPTHGLVVVRLGKYRMARAGGAALDRGFELFMDAVKPKH